ncbi:hypothetical protein [Parasitella parasitica]|uniref:Uncharacterized protein n=1 Tax=Parasitella parasitica TaxID=35722 RepID=A0A0B7NDC0_9FUNG|nr:hypothetical protein [Parasitella parasitica]
MDSEEYKYYKYTEESSMNHPSIDRDVVSLYSSYKSQSIPSQIHSESMYAHIRPKEPNISKSVFSEPLRKKATISLTEEALAIHNSEIPPQPPVYPPNMDDEDDTDLLMERRLEEQFTKAEQDYSQSRNDIEELSLMEKQYIDQGIQTDILNRDVEQLQQMENTLHDLSLNPKEFRDQVNQWKQDAEQYTQARKIIWDSPFVPVDSICRQLPTAVHLEDIENDQDICELHLDRYYKVKNRLAREKESNQQDYHATLARLSNMVKQ